MLDPCDGCGPHECDDDTCIIQDVGFIEECPCKECLVKMTCLFGQQACDDFMALYDKCDDILKNRGYLKEFL